MIDPAGLPDPERVGLLGTAHDLAEPAPVAHHPPRTWADVPWRTIAGSVAVVLGTYLAVEVVLDTVQVISWIVVAGFFAIVLGPAVHRVNAHVGGRRGVATGIVVFSTLVGVLGTIGLFVFTVRTQLIGILTDLPGTINDAASGHGPVGRLVTKLHLESYVKSHEDELKKAAARLSGSSYNIARTVIGAVLALATITIIAFLFLSQAEAMGRTAMSLIPIRHREAVRRTSVDAARAISGYMIGNLLISLIAGTTSFICLFALGVPSALVISLWVAFADLIPLVGATMGAAVGVIAAFLQGTTPGVITIVFYVVYQQIENGVLYPLIMSRRVKVNPLVVLLSVLLAVEIFGFIGALLAVPFSGALQVIVKAIRTERRQDALIVPTAWRNRA
ncbi:MAG TPA: AI-2E family transporter [Ilumatobacteraceae bacterium]